MPVWLGMGLVFGSGAVAHYKSIIKLQFYLLFFFLHAVIRDEHDSNSDSVKCTLGYVSFVSFTLQESYFDKCVIERLKPIRVVSLCLSLQEFIFSTER